MSSKFGHFHSQLKPKKRSMAWLFWLIVLVGLGVFLNFKWGNLPPFGKLLSPFEGALQITRQDYQRPGVYELTGKAGPVVVELDGELIPHISAKSIEDMFMAQGFITAQHRLWQMDFQNRAASGRLSELVGEKALEFDKFQRRFGIKEAARRSGQEMMNHPETKLALDAFADGINQAISTWPSRQLPLEFKLLDYEPEVWQAESTGLLLKRMAFTLSAGSEDKAMNLILEKYGKSVVDQLFPNHLHGEDPIIPKGTQWNFKPLPVPVIPLSLGWTDTTDDGIPAPKDKLRDDEGIEAKAEIGSNNWAISGKKTKSGKPILANDPHLSMKLPATWYIAELKAPGYHAMGASIPGAPGIISGFNDDFAWGVTNGYPDVCDWYKVAFKDSDRKHYWYDGNWRPTVLHIETIRIRGKEDVKDSVYWTHLGPVVYLKGQTPFQANIPIGHALRWVAHDPSNEMLSFLRINQNHSVLTMDSALSSYGSPAQNFVCADKEGNIGMFSQQGKIPLRWNSQGKFLLQASLPDQDWNAFLPATHLPRSVNPEQGFLSSANQVPTDSTYPYYLNWNYEALDRGRRINEVLRESSDFDFAKVLQLQNDNLNLWARKSLPVFLEKMENTPVKQAWALEVLKKWDYKNEANSVGATLFETWWKRWMDLCWSDNFTESMRQPNRSLTLQILLEKDNSDWFDYSKTKELETGSELVRRSFADALDTLIKQNGPYVSNPDRWQWGHVKATTIEHLAKISGLGTGVLYCGGGKGIVNATSTTTGQSWKMMVELGEKPSAMVVFPGGQSGNPSSIYYSNLVETWRKGQLLPLKMKW